MPAHRLQDEPLDAVVNIRMTATEKAEMRAQADVAGLSMSVYGRRRLTGCKVISQTDSAVISELRRLGGLVKRIQNQSGGAYSREVAEYLAAMRQTTERIARDR